MSRSVAIQALTCAGLAVSFGMAAQAADSSGQVTGNPVIQWNKTLLSIVRTKGAQPATLHPTRSFAILHAAMYDAVNSIEGDHRAYRIRIEGVSALASEE